MPRRNDYLRSMMAEFHAAKQAWWELAEYETMFYEVELAEYKAEHPMPRLKDFMVARRVERQAAEDAAVREAAWFAALEAEWLAEEQSA